MYLCGNVDVNYNHPYINNSILLSATYIKFYIMYVYVRARVRVRAKRDSGVFKN